MSVVVACSGSDGSTQPIDCEPPDTVPFSPTSLSIEPLGLQLSPMSHVAVWPVPGGMFEVWNGIRDDLPVPAVGSEKHISVLDRQAVIGDISDGYSVVFDLGPTACERWAIVAHPGSTRADLEALAAGLQMTDQK